MDFTGKGYKHRPISRQGDVIVAGCYQATTMRTRTKGLLKQTSLEDGQGLLLSEGLVHMRGMKMPLDLVFINRKGVITKVKENVQPGYLLHGSIFGKYTLELSVGQADALGLVMGLQLTF